MVMSHHCEHVHIGSPPNYDWVTCTNQATENHPDDGYYGLPRYCADHAIGATSTPRKKKKKRRGVSDYCGYENLPHGEGSITLSRRISADERIIRNLQIIALRRSGMKIADIATRFGLSYSYVSVLSKG